MGVFSFKRKIWGKNFYPKFGMSGRKFFDNKRFSDSECRQPKKFTAPRPRCHVATATIDSVYHAASLISHRRRRCRRGRCRSCTVGTASRTRRNRDAPAAGRPHSADGVPWATSTARTSVRAAAASYRRTAT